MIIASIMTGTSVDGVDIFIMDYDKKEKLGFYSYDFKTEESDYIKGFLWPNSKNMMEISNFNFKFSEIVASYYNKMPQPLRDKVKFVAYHGQTVFHDPNKEFSNDISTMQLGNGAVLANKIGTDVICDLRSSDVAMGGQGAPLVPYGDKYLFWKNNNVAILNIGGISNVTIIDKDGDIKGFDLGVGNALMDAYVKREFNINYDKDGLIAAKGNLNDDFLNYLINKDEFMRQMPPKSTGKEKYNLEYIDEYIKSNNLPKEDVLRTLNVYTLETIKTLKEFIKTNEFEIYVAGGGAYNKFLFESMKNSFKNFDSIDKIGYTPQEREAASFGMLAYYFINDMRIGSTTGATKETIPGAHYKK